MRLLEEFREETVINKSRFIACVERCETEEEARTYIESIRKEFPDATHVCTAYVCGKNNMIQRSSDRRRMELSRMARPSFSAALIIRVLSSSSADF